jgi:hypothetical protein
MEQMPQQNYRASNAAEPAMEVHLQSHQEHQMTERSTNDMPSEQSIDAITFLASDARNNGEPDRAPSFLPEVPATPEEHDDRKTEGQLPKGTRYSP